MISVSCPGCQKAYRIDEKFVAKKLRCKACGELFYSNDAPTEPEIVAGLAARVNLPEKKTKTVTIPQQSVVETGESDQPRTRKAYVQTDPPQRKRSKKTVSDDDEFLSAGERIDEELPALPKKRTGSNEEKAAPKKKSKKQQSSSGGPLIAIVVGLIGGAIGAGLWGTIAYFTHREVGYVAWGIGGLVGICVRAGAQDMDEGIAGVIAAVISVFSILAGKLLAAIYIVNWVLKQGELLGIEQEEVYWSLVAKAFQLSFGIFDIVFFLLALGTSFKIASGHSDN